MRKLLLVATSFAALTVLSCNQSEAILKDPNESEAISAANTSNKTPTIQDAKEFIEQTEKELIELGEYAARIYWVNANFITYDTNWLAEKVGAEEAKLSTRLSNEAKKFNGLDLPADMARKLDMLKRGSYFPAPEIDGAPEELSGIMTRLDTDYSTGKFRHKGEEISLYEATDIIAKSRDPEELAAVWAGWREISPKMKNNYARMVAIINQGSLELGYNDAGVLWRSGYDMPADDFVKEADRLWGQVKPLYDELHCHVRAKLNENYGDEIVSLDQPIRADLLGNMSVSYTHLTLPTICSV